MQHLRVYQLAVRFHREIQNLPVKGELRDQLHRAAISIVLNISESTGRLHSPKDQLRFAKIAFGSVRECQACLDLLPQYVSPVLRDLIDHLASSMWKFIKIQC